MREYTQGTAYRAENEENLNIHLFTCETFNCEDCEPKVMLKNLSRNESSSDQ